MPTPRIEEMKFKEYAYQVKHKDCQMVLDHDISWCGDCYACKKCGKVFIWSGVVNEALTEAHQAGIDEAVEIIKNKGSYLDSQFQWKKELLEALQDNK